MRVLWTAAMTLTVTACISVNGFAQTSQLVFTAAVPESSPSNPAPRLSAVVEERGLALWTGAASDFGVGVVLARPQWTLRSITSVTELPVSGHGRPTFQQIEIVRPLFSNGSVSVAGGGGVRQDWDGSRVFIGRMLARSEVGNGQLQGGVVLERAVSSPLKRDAADVITSLGWSRRVGRGTSLGIEALGQDLEGLWNPAEADGGARLLVGPSFHAQSRSAKWAASLIAGPVVHRPTTTAPPNVAPATRSFVGDHFGLFASASWIP